MPFYILYLVKVSICLAVVFLFYHFVLRKLTFYAWNRFYLLGYTIFSFLVPLMDISPVLERNKWSEATVVDWIPVLGNKEFAAEQVRATGEINLAGWIALFILAGMLFLFLRLCIQLVSFYRMKRNALRLHTEGLLIYQVDEKIIPFSFGNAIYINRNQHSAEELEEIIKHEWVHVKQKHSIDILLAEILCLVNWYNPFAWLLRKSIRQNLEFIADRKVLSAGMDPKAYQYLLLKVTGNYQFSIASQFNFSSLKKRIAMMNKLKSHRVNLLRFLFILPLAAVVLLSFRKQFGQSPVQMSNPDQRMIMDTTVPDITTLNSRGYLVKVVDTKVDCTVLVKDKNNKEITRVSLNDWKQKHDHYTALYGEIPPPPPPHPSVVIAPVPPVIPTPVTIPDNIEKLEVSKSQNKITITLKSGEVETYNLSVPSEKKALEEKYGPLTPPPPPTPSVHSPGFSRLSAVSNEWEITDKKATIKRKDGVTESYDLTDKKEKAEFESRYGQIRNVSVTAPVAEGVNNNVEIVTGAQLARMVPDGKGVNTIQSDKGVATVTGVQLARTVPDAAGKGVYHVQADNGVTTIAVTPSVSSTNGSGSSGNVTNLSLAPTLSTAVRDDLGHTITGKEDVIVTITPETTKEELEKMKKLMKNKSVDLEFSEVKFSNGKLVSVRGTMVSGSSKSRFQSDDFEVLSLAKIISGKNVILKVNSVPKKAKSL